MRIILLTKNCREKNLLNDLCVDWTGSSIRTISSQVKFDDSCDAERPLTSLEDSLHWYLLELLSPDEDFKQPPLVGLRWRYGRPTRRCRCDVLTPSIDSDAFSGPSELGHAHAPAPTDA